MKKIFTYMLLLVVLICALTGCFTQSINIEISKALGISIPSNLKIQYEDTHGGFHGDGITLAKTQFEDKDAENMLSEIKGNDNWKALPLPENIALEMYGGERDSVIYRSHLAEKLGMPKLQNGYWIFIDRYNHESKITNGEGLFPRYAANYTLGIYDADSNTLYYCKYDS